MVKLTLSMELKDTKRYIFSMMAAGVLAACGSLESISFDQLNPATHNFPEQIKNVAIINNAPPTPETKPNQMALGQMEGNGQLSAEALASSLADSKFFNQIIICDSSLYSADSRELDRATVAELTQNLDADMLISLDRVLIDKQRHDIYYPGMDMPWTIVRVKFTPVVSLYVPSREKPMQVIAKTDSLEWNVDEIISDQDLLKEAASFSAYILSKELVPHWSTADRYYFSGGSSNMRDAAVFVKEHNWQRAAEIWKSVFDGSKSDNTKMKAAFNLALSSEMTGQMEEALRWMEEAKQRIKEGSQEDAIWKIYNVQLQKRNEDYMKLNAQMSRF